MPDLHSAEIAIPLDRGQSTTGILYRSRSTVQPPATLILAHGAGAGQRHPFMIARAHGLSERGLDVLTFDFLYMQQRRRVPDRMPALVACYEAVISSAREQIASARPCLFIGGKSMGGRAATHVAAGAPFSSVASGFPVKGIVLLGYPLHAPGRPDQLRDAHLPDVKLPMLFVQGSRDTFGTPAELTPIIERLAPRPTLHAVEGGDHSFKVGGRDAANRQAAIYGEIEDTIVEWIAKIDSGSRLPA